MKLILALLLAYAARAETPETFVSVFLVEPAHVEIQLGRKSYASPFTQKDLKGCVQRIYYSADFSKQYIVIEGPIKMDKALTKVYEKIEEAVAEVDFEDLEAELKSGAVK